MIQADLSLMEKTDDTINVDLWYTGAYDLFQAGIDLTKYSQMQEIFNKNVMFQPRTLTMNCESCTDAMKKQCIDNGKYCPIIPIQLRTDQEIHISPKNLIMQSVREQCVFENLNDLKKSHWFSYMDLLTF